MSQTITGLATIHSGGGTLTFSAIIANGKADAQSPVSFARRADIEDRPNFNGEPVGFKKRNDRWEVTVTCFCATSDFPTTNANSDALKAALLPKELSVVTLADFTEATRTGDAATYGCPSLNGAYVYKEGGTMEISGDWLKITLPLVKYAHETAANLTKAVT